MSLRNRHHHERRRRVAVRLLKLSALALALLTTAFYAYHVGVFVTQDEVTRLVQEVQRASLETDRLGAELGRAQAALAHSDQERRRLGATVASIQPEPDLEAVVGLVRARLRAGLPQDRLMLAIERVRVPTDCGAVPDKRLPVAVSGRGADSIRNGEGADAVTVTAEGIPAMARNGGKQPWFDPAKPVTLRFKPATGRASEVSGVLPLSHTVVTAGHEHRFAIRAGARGMVMVGGDRCGLRAG